MTATDTTAGLTTDPTFLAMFDATANGRQRFLVLADWCQDRDGPAELLLALRAMGEGVKVGVKTWTAGRYDTGFRAGWFWVNGRTASTYRRSLTGFETVGETFADVVARFARVLADEANKVGKRAERSKARADLAAGWVNPLAVGDVVVNSWGYDQTNVEFAQVVKVGPRSVVLRPIAQRSIREMGPMAEMVAPVKDGFAGEPFTVRWTLRVYGGKLHASLPARHGSWTKTEREEGHYQSWYA